jgi:hypothetical protein
MDSQEVERYLAMLDTWSSSELRKLAESLPNGYPVEAKVAAESILDARESGKVASDKMLEYQGLVPRQEGHGSHGIAQVVSWLFAVASGCFLWLEADSVLPILKHGGHLSAADVVVFPVFAAICWFMAWVTRRYAFRER